MTQLDILLYSPKPQSPTELLYKLSGILHPLGLGYIASALRRSGYSVELIDNAIERWNSHLLKKYLLAHRPRVLGLSLYTGCLSDALAFADQAKNILKDIIVIAGGPHASALPKETLKHPSIDIIVKGEGEETSREVMNALLHHGKLCDVAGIVYKNEGHIHENPNRPMIADLDTVPLPAYDLMPMASYFPAPSRRFTRGKSGSIMTSRGCPYRCSFCSRAVFGQSVRFRSPDSVVKEIAYLVSQFGIEEFEIRDDTFTLDEDRVVDICHRLISMKLNLVWNCYGRVDRLSDRLFSALYKAGCRTLIIGVESGSQKILDYLNKDITLGQIESAIETCRKHKILSSCSFLLGTPHETPQTLLETINFAKKLDPDYASFCAYTPLPGSELFDELVAKKIINPLAAQWDSYQRFLLVPPEVQVGEISRRELVRWQKLAMRMFYMRPGYIYRKFQNIKSLSDLRQILIGLHVVIGHQLRKIKT